MPRIDLPFLKTAAASLVICSATAATLTAALALLSMQQNGERLENLVHGTLWTCGPYGLMGVAALRWRVGVAASITILVGVILQCGIGMLLAYDTYEMAVMQQEGRRVMNCGPPPMLVVPLLQYVGFSIVYVFAILLDGVQHYMRRGSGLGTASTSRPINSSAETGIQPESWPRR